MEGGKNLVLSALVVGGLGLSGCSHLQKSLAPYNDGVHTTLENGGKGKEEMSGIMKEITKEDIERAISSGKEVNFSLYGFGGRNKGGSYNGLGVQINGKNYKVTAEFAKDIKMVAGYFDTNYKKIDIRVLGGILNKGINYKGHKFNGTALRIGIVAAVQTGKLKVKGGVIASFLTGLKHADTTTIIGFIKGNYDVNDIISLSGEASNINTYGKNYSNFKAGVDFKIPETNLVIGGSYNSRKNPNNWNARVGFSSKFNDYSDILRNGKIIAQVEGTKGHVSGALKYNINKGAWFKSDETGYNYVINKGFYPQEYANKKFNQKLDQNIEDKEKSAVKLVNDKFSIDLGKYKGVSEIPLDVLSNDNQGKFKITSVTGENFKVSDNGKLVYFTVPKNLKPGTTYKFKGSYTVAGKTANINVELIVPEAEEPVTPPNPHNNTAPKANPDSAQTKKDNSVIIDVLYNDKDKDGDTIKIKSVTQPANGKAEIVNGKIKYTPKAGYTGTDTFTYTDSDGKLDSKPATVTVKVVNTTPVNHNPDAKDDSASTDENKKVVINVLDNDSDQDGDTITIKDITTSPKNGTAKIVDNKIEYTPNAGFSGEDRFEYKISDGKGGFDKAIVIVKVKDVNHAPTINQTSFDGGFKKSETFQNVVSDDGGLGNITMTASPTEGTLVYNGDGSITYTRTDGNAGGSDVFDVTFSDGTKQTTSSMTFTGFDDE